MYIRLKVTANAKRESVKKITDDHYDISVKEPAEQNRANKRVLEIMRRELASSGKPSGSGPVIRLVSGHHSPSKIIAVGE